MWQEAKANDKRIRELMVDHRKRAERRRAYYESRLGDPQQLIRVIGSSSKLYPDAEQFYYHENTDNLMPWPGNPEIKIDRFDGRSLLDFVPESVETYKVSRTEEEMSEELNFERYHDLIEAERLKITEAERLATVEEEWTKLLDRHQAKLAMLEKDQNRKNKASFGFDYGTRKVSADEEIDDLDDEKESRLLKEVNILQYVDDLTDKDRQILNEMSSKYGIRSYARLLRVAKKDQDSELRALRRKEKEKTKTDDGLTRAERKKRRRRKRRRRRRETLGKDEYGRQRRRHSPSYNAFDDDEDDDSEYTDDSETSTDGSTTDNGSEDSDFQIEFGSNSPEDQQKKEDDKEDTTHDSQYKKGSSSGSQSLSTEIKLTPMEKLKLKMRAGLAKTIESDERDRKQKEKETELEQLQELARSQGLPINAYLEPDLALRDNAKEEIGSSTTYRKERYRSPSTSADEKEPTVSASSSMKKRYRSPSTSADEKDHKLHAASATLNKPSSGRYRFPSTPHTRSRSRSPLYAYSKNSGYKRRKYRSPSGSRSRSRSRSRSERERRYNQQPHAVTTRRNTKHLSPPASSSTSRHRYRSPTTSDEDEHRRYRSIERKRNSYHGSSSSRSKRYSRSRSRDRSRREGKTHRR
ncbi:alternative splicing regulator-domain-containing protein [Mycotypha africana]|uniref:alternative splicing regulator-domain-containing protein n=1 Tax=Mycotypha africana TaxID=64632 RepID=UPI0022FFF24A|nr:alternative splicing regulator-domain-containing protein [Mycotypha africana]KAI8977151.1 alternative splicing regulator-domain-containing protein [Mycotypha africana]